MKAIISIFLVTFLTLEPLNANICKDLLGSFSSANNYKHSILDRLPIIGPWLRTRAQISLNQNQNEQKKALIEEAEFLKGYTAVKFLEVSYNMEYSFLEPRRLFEAKTMKDLRLEVLKQYMDLISTIILEKDELDIMLFNVNGRLKHNDSNVRVTRSVLIDHLSSISDQVSMLSDSVSKGTESLPSHIFNTDYQKALENSLDPVVVSREQVFTDKEPLLQDYSSEVVYRAHHAAWVERGRGDQDIAGNQKFNSILEAYLSGQTSGLKPWFLELANISLSHDLNIIFSND